MSTGELRPDELEVAPGFARTDLHGWIPELASPEELRESLEKAFDYRGDITLTVRDGRVIQGYVYDRRLGATLEQSLVRILPSNGSPRVSIPFSEVTRLVFSGRDTAAGRSWEAWVRKYWEKRAQGEQASIDSEPLD